jgi:hypothetical protein
MKNMDQQSIWRCLWLEHFFNSGCLGVWHAVYILAAGSLEHLFTDVIFFPNLSIPDSFSKVVMERRKGQQIYELLSSPDSCPIDSSFWSATTRKWLI